MSRFFCADFFVTFVCVILFLATSPKADAALLYFDPDQASVYRGDTLSVALRVDVEEGECINTIDAVIHYDASLSADDVSRGDSIFSLWVESPVIDETAHTIRFAGGIPGGYCGRIPGDPSLTNEVLQLVFRSPGLMIGGGSDDNNARVWLGDETQILLHDGLGTNATAQLQDMSITLLDTAGSAPSDEWTQQVRDDETIPSDFVITLARDELAFGGKYFVTFNALDKQSGIDHYEIMEEPFSEFYSFKWGRADAPWITTESPYVLKDQTLNSTIRVKVIDKAGNERIEVLVPDEAQRSISQDKLIAVLLACGFALIIIILIVYALIMRRRKLLSEISVINNE